MSGSDRPHRLAFVLDRPGPASPVAELVSWAEMDPRVELAGIVLPSGAELKQAGGLASVALGLLESVERRLVLHAGSGSEGPLHGELAGKAIAVDPAGVRALQTDLLVGFGATADPELASTARLGLLSLDLHDGRNARSNPPGFWEVLARRPTTGFTATHHPASGEPPTVVGRGSFSTEVFYLRNAETLAAKAASYFRTVILDLLDGRPRTLPAPACDRAETSPPRFADVAAYAAKTGAFLLGKALSKALGRRWHWGVGYAFGDWKTLDLGQASWLPAPRGHFIADPFAFRNDGQDYIFVEDSDFRKGVISAYRVGRGSARAEFLGTAIDEPFHLSYPFVFRAGDDIFMVPESSANRDVRLYRCTSFPLQWTLESILLDDIAAVDSMLFRRSGKWHMLTTVNASRTGGCDAELCLYSAGELDGPWLPHPSNPLFVDASRGRSGGYLSDSASLYRVAQRPGFALYGRAMSIYRIDELSDDGYAESFVRDVEPDFLAGISGTHHFNNDGDLVVFDYLVRRR